MTAPAVTPAARRLAKAAGVRPVAAQRVLDGLEVWPGTYEAVSAVALACGVVGLPEPAPRASRRPPPRPCPACAAKDAELAELRARYESEARVADTWRAASGRIVASLLGEPCVVAMPDHTEDVIRETVTALRARVAELEALPHPKPFDHAPGVLHRHYPKAGEPVLCSSVPAPSGGEPPPIPPTMETSAEDSRLAVAPKPPRPAPRPRCHVSLELPDGTVTTPAEAAG